MPNRAFIVGGGVGIAATAAGATALAGGFGAGKPQDPLFNVEDSKIPEGIKLSDVASFKTHQPQLPCANSMFSSVNWDSKSSAQSSISIKVKPESQENKQDFEFSGNKEQACLDVWWDKETYNNKWKGNWNLVWALQDGTYGILIFSSISTNDGKLKANAATYALQKNNDKWDIIGKLEATNKEIAAGTEGKLVIKRGSIVEDENDYWWNFGFGQSGICSSSECTGENGVKSFYKKSWNFSRGGEKTIDKWSENLDDWNGSSGLFVNSNKSIYNNIKGKFKLTNYSSSWKGK